MAPQVERSKHASIKWFLVAISIRYQKNNEEQPQLRPKESLGDKVVRPIFQATRLPFGRTQKTSSI
jgi:hypothetical protein